ncbi:hypothetical protein PCL_03392 [Purpureocillium lilacinum]|uniref:Uncharacterized protein n=1 Tax=Purpureocillium lilacinum TaxID=33203 RepID=A0A2U3ENW1_PURLI|nr:hypothetical protein Purlil1_4925 [Purpureocillium lilacinum]PWI76198.1 hypothetical protein PCL_03392 [Purpureocillium lilacinum]
MTMAAGPTDDGGAPISSLPPVRPSARPRICLGGAAGLDLLSGGAGHLAQSELQWLTAEPRLERITSPGWRWMGEHTHTSTRTHAAYRTAPIQAPTGLVLAIPMPCSPPPAAPRPQSAAG